MPYGHMKQPYLLLPGWIVAVLLGYPSSVLAQYTADDLLKVYESCKSATENKRFDSLRGKMPLFAGQSGPFNPPDRKPQGPEFAALRALYAETIRCSMSYARLNNPEAKSPLMVSESSLAHLSALALLKDGYSTFLDYTRWSQEKVTESAQRYQAEIKNREEQERRQQEEAQRAQATQSVILLSCIAENPNDMRGVEFQYQVDQRNNSIWASRGNGSPNNVQIGPSQISFWQEQQRVTISRLTGTFTLAVAGTLIITGRCSRATSQAF